MKILKSNEWSNQIEFDLERYKDAESVCLTKILNMHWISAQLKTLFQKTTWRYAAAFLLCAYALWTISSAWMHLGHH